MRHAEGLFLYLVAASLAAIAFVNATVPMSGEPEDISYRIDCALDRTGSIALSSFAWNFSRACLIGAGDWNGFAAGFDRPSWFRDKSSVTLQLEWPDNYRPWPIQVLKARTAPGGGQCRAVGPDTRLVKLGRSGATATVGLQ
jgi:hypothetical protein